MQSSTFRVISGLITLLLLAALVGVVALTMRSQPATLVLPTPAPQPTFTPTATPQLTVTLGAELNVAPGGYTIKLPIGYDLDLQGSAVKLSNNISDTQMAAFWVDGGSLTGFVGEGSQTLAAAFAQYANTLADQNDFQVGQATSSSVDGVVALSADLTGRSDSALKNGRVIMLQPAQGQIFLLAGAAPQDGWQTPVRAVFDAILASARFYPPVAPTLTAASATPSPTPTTRPAATTTPILRSVATPTPKADAGLLPNPTATSTPPAKPAAGEWTTFSDANVGSQLTVISNTIWIATEGGALAWSKGSISPVKFTAVDGLDGNRLTAVVNCPLPELGVVFGSERGLQVVDPRAGGWKHLNSDNSDLSHDDVSALVCDAKNQFMVVGFARHGIDVFDAADQKWRHLDRNSGLASNDVNHLAVVGDREAIWVVSNDGVTVAAGQDSTFYNADNSPLADNRIGAIVADPSGVVWLGGEGALYRVDGETWTVFGAETVNDEPFPAQLITGLAVAPDGTLWLGSIDAEICHFSPEERRCLQRFSNQDGMAVGPLTNLTLDSTGQVYYTTAGNGYSRYDGGQWRSFVKTDEVVRGNQVKALAVDDTGAQWVATELGVQRFTEPGKPGELFDAENSGIAVAAVRALAPGSEGGLWVGGQGASFFDGDIWQTLTISDGLAGAIVQAITVDGQQRTWFGTDSGLSVWNGAVFFNITKDRGLPSDNITALVADGNAVWIGTQGGGLYRFENSQLQIFNQENVGLPSDTITALTLTGDGALLIGTDRGLAQFKDGSVNLPADAPALMISALAAQGKEIWAGTAESGVFHFDGTAWRQLTGADGLPSDSIAAILATDKATWIGGQDGGLVRYNP